MIIKRQIKVLLFIIITASSFIYQKAYAGTGLNTESSSINCMYMVPNSSEIAVATRTSLFLFKNGQWNKLNTKMGPNSNIDDVAGAGITSVSMSTDGSMILAGTCFGAYLYKDKKWREAKLSGDSFPYGIHSTAISTDGKIMILSGERHCYINHNNKWEKLQFPGIKYTNKFNLILISRNSKTIYIAGYDNGYLYQNKKWKAINIYSWGINSAALSSDGESLIVNSSLDGLSLADSNIQKKSLWAKLKNAFSPSSGSNDSNARTKNILLSNGTFFPLKLDEFDTETFRCVAISADGKKALVGGDTSAYLFDSGKWKNLSYYGLPEILNVYSVAISDNGAKMLVASKVGLYLFDNNKWELLNKKYPFLYSIGPVAAKMTDNGNLLAISTKEKGVFLLRNGTWHQFVFKENNVLEFNEEKIKESIKPPKYIPSYKKVPKYKINHKDKTIEWNN